MTIHNTLEETSSQTEELIFNLTSETRDPSFHLTAIDYFLPASSIITDSGKHPQYLFEKEKLIFSYMAVIKTIESCIGKKYSDFDGHTTSNCCHGMAILVMNLINSVCQLDLNQFLLDGRKKIQNIQNSSDKLEQCTWKIPFALANLSCLYLLKLIMESDLLKGARTNTKKLKTLATISTNFCNKIAHDLQKRFSNLIASNYDAFRDSFDNKMNINGAPISMWGKYVRPEYIRTDRRGVNYVSNLFSMQIALAYLIKSQAKVALINDILDSEGSLVDRYIRLFQGDGQENLRVLSQEEEKLLKFSDENEPVVVFGGCVYSDQLDIESLDLQMQPWLDNLPGLILACDVFYPQFIKVIDDPEFDSSPINPDEKLLRQIIESSMKIKGVSEENPSLYCATHIYPASLEQVMNLRKTRSETALPVSFIPATKSTNLEKTSL